MRGAENGTPRRCACWNVPTPTAIHDRLPVFHARGISRGRREEDAAGGRFGDEVSAAAVRNAIGPWSRRRPTADPGRGPAFPRSAPRRWRRSFYLEEAAQGRPAVRRGGLVLGDRIGRGKLGVPVFPLHGGSSPRRIGTGPGSEAGAAAATSVAEEVGGPPRPRGGAVRHGRGSRPDFTSGKGRDDPGKRKGVFFFSSCPRRSSAARACRSWPSTLAGLEDGGDARRRAGAPGPSQAPPSVSEGTDRQRTGNMKGVQAPLEGDPHGRKKVKKIVAIKVRGPGSR